MSTRIHLAYHLLQQFSHPPSWGHIPLPPPCMCSMGFHPHIPGSHPCLRFCPHQSRVSSPPKVSSSPSMVVTTYSPGDKMALQAGRLGLSHWAGPSVTGSTSESQGLNGGIIVVILAKGREVPLVWQFMSITQDVIYVTSPSF